MPLCFFHLILNIDRKICKFLYPSPWPSLSHFLSPFFAAVALSVIDTSSSNFFAENWTQFPYLEIGNSEGAPLENSDNNNNHGEENQKKVNNAAVTVNSNKENPATSAISSSRDTKDKG